MKNKLEKCCIIQCILLILGIEKQDNYEGL